MFREELYQILMQLRICLTKVTENNSMILVQKFTYAVTLFRVKIRNLRDRSVSLKVVFSQLY